MTEEVKNIFKVASIYMGTIIGAGFASGREIVQFFSTYYEGGFYGIILAGCLFSAIGYLVLDKVYRERIRNYDEFLFPTLGWVAGWIVEIAVTLFVLSIFSIMVTGAGYIIAEKLSIPFKYAVMLTALICMFFILADIKGVAALSSIVTPFLIAGILIIGFYIIIFRDTAVFNVSEGLQKAAHNWFLSSLLYVGYNSLLAVVVLCSLLPYLKTRRTGILGGIFGGIMLCFAAFVLNFAITMFYPEALAKEIPVLSIIKKYSALLSNLYTFILWLAMFLSAVTSGYCFIDRITSKVKVNAKLLAAAMCALVVSVSGFGFSNLIASIYPIFGYVGLFMMFVILLQGVKIVPARLYERKRNK